MISERQLSEVFHSFWQSQFPLLNGMFVRRFNSEHKKQLYSLDGTSIAAIPAGRAITRSDLIAELAFELVIEKQRARLGEPPDTERATERAIDRVSRFFGARLRPPSPPENAEAAALVSNYDHFFATVIPDGKVTFRPRIRGAGIVNQMEGDFCTHDTLFEVKSVERNLHSSDLRQVLCYLVAGIGSREYFWNSYCIFNPRLAVYYTGRIDDLLSHLSGRTSSECIAEVLNAMTEREQPIEAVF